MPGGMMSFEPMAANEVIGSNLLDRSFRRIFRIYRIYRIIEPNDVPLTDFIKIKYSIIL